MKKLILLLGLMVGLSAQAKIIVGSGTTYFLNTKGKLCAATMYVISGTKKEVRQQLEFSRRGGKVEWLYLGTGEVFVTISRRIER